MKPLLEFLEAMRLCRRSVACFTPGQKTVEWVQRVDETSRRLNPPCGFFIANRGSAVDAQKALRKSISEVSKDHKDPLAAKIKS